MAIINIILDFALIGAAIWMVISVRGLGGIIGKGLNLITIGTIILGVAHLGATLLHAISPMDSPTEGLIHRIFVFAGFIFLIVGFRQIEKVKN